jgi:hypothetical protein
VLGAFLSGPSVEQVIGGLAGRLQHQILAGIAGFHGERDFKAFLFHRRSYAIAADKSS